MTEDVDVGLFLDALHLVTGHGEVATAAALDVDLGLERLRQPASYVKWRSDLMA